MPDAWTMQKVEPLSLHNMNNIQQTTVSHHVDIKEGRYLSVVIEFVIHFKD